MEATITNIRNAGINLQYTEKPAVELSNYDKRFKPDVPDGTAVINQVSIDLFTDRYAGRVVLGGMILNGDTGAEFNLICYACEFTRIIPCLTNNCRIYDDATLEITEDNNKVSYPPSVFIQDGMDNLEKYAVIHPKLGEIRDLALWRKHRIENKARF